MLHNELNHLLNNLTIQNIDTTLSQLLLLIKEESYYLQLIEIREEYQDCENNLWRLTKEQQNFQKKKIVANIHNIINHFLITYPQVSNMSIKPRLKKLVSIGKVEEVIKELLTATENKQNSLHNDLNALSSRYNENESDKRKDIISGDEYRRVLNKITDTLLNYIDKYDENAIVIVDKKNNSTNDTEDEVQTKVKILMLTANYGERLNIEMEHSKIIQKLQEKQHQFLFTIEKGISDTDFMEKTTTNKPYLLHFSGHGDEGYLQVIDENGKPAKLTNEGLDAYFEYFKEERIGIKAVILNACFSQEQAEIICKYIPYVIGTTVQLNDNHAIAFSQGFYFKLADEISNIESAYKAGVAQARGKGAKKEHFVIYKDGKLLS